MIIGLFIFMLVMLSYPVKRNEFVMLTEQRCVKKVEDSFLTCKLAPTNL